MKYKEIETIDEVKDILNKSELKHYAFQNIDFSDVEDLVLEKTFTDCLFLGCTIPSSLNNKTTNSLVFPLLDVPFNVFRSSLYNRHNLLGEYQLGNPGSYNKTTDMVIYHHYMEQGKEAKDIKETLARRLHDHSITDALYDFLDNFEEKKIVAIMGGHSLPRNDENYLTVAKISKQLTEDGYLMISGGGPGAMEATHVGAWMAGKKEKELIRVVKILSEAPVYNDKLWLDKAYEVFEEYPTSDYKSLGVPTWLYGHEPPTPFATHIAKYFANSVREDSLLTIAKGGVIFAPGSAGTIQEIFQETTQNHYLSFGYASPMIFLNSDYWVNDRPIYPLFTKMIAEGKFKNLIISKCDNDNEVVREIKKFTPNRR